MGRGSYIGGSTICGKWSDWQAFPEQGPTKPIKNAKNRKQPKYNIKKLRQNVPAEALPVKEHLKARDKAIQELGFGKIPKNLKKRAKFLKMLRQEGALTASGTINSKYRK